MVREGGHAWRLVATVTAAGILAAAVLANARSAPAGATAVTIGARPTIAGPDQPVTLFGSVSSGRPGENVEIQAKDCGHAFFRTVSGAHTGPGGRWATDYFPAIGTQVRAVWNGQVSRPIRLHQRAMLRLVPKASDRTQFVVSVVARAQFWHRKVVIERLRRGAWSRFRTVVLAKQTAPGEFVWTSGEFRARLERGTMLRALLPQSQAGPCYCSA
jgi:hypothetical protein